MRWGNMDTGPWGVEGEFASKNSTGWNRESHCAAKVSEGILAPDSTKETGLAP